MTALLLATSFISIGAYAAQSPETASLNVSLINQNPDPARAGETLELRFMLENNGGTAATNIQYELVPTFPFVAIPDENYRRTINTLSAYQQGDDAVIIKFRVMVDREAVKGTNEIQLKRYFAGSNITTAVSYDVEVTGTEYAQIIYVDKSKLYPGNETPLSFTITNVGNSPLRDLVFSWAEDEGVILPVYSDDTKYIKNIDVGESVVLEYMVVADVNAVQGLYQLDLNLKYETVSGVTEQISTKAGIFVGGGTDFDVTFSESSEGVTSLSVANVGNNPAYSVTVKIPGQEGYRVSGSTSTIVGNLDKGDYTIVSFQITQVAGGAIADANFSQMTREERLARMQSTEGLMQNNLIVLIDYTDTTGIRHTTRKEVPIQFRDDSTASTATTTRFARAAGTESSVYLTYIMYGALAVVAIAALIAYRKRDAVRRLLGKASRKKG
ncbi:MAG: COG1361 S-layer family protein [Candidatus Aenigmarchaeota archaeon]|nr:COG1361 S-layer family protein [Candidatus Aenigmarchaeota archaeon]